MTDARLRSAERRGDKVTVLRERLRSQDEACAACRGGGQQSGARTIPHADGSISYGEPWCYPCPPCAGTGLTLRPRAMLAAYCGDEDALEAVGAKEVHGPSPEGPVAPWPCTVMYDRWTRLHLFAAGLSRWGPAVAVRAAVAAAKVADQRWQGDWNPGIFSESRCAPSRVIAAAEAWLACPCDRHEVEWSRAGIACADGGNLVLTWLPIPPDVDTHGHNLGSVPTGAAQRTEMSAVRAAIQSVLIEWAYS